MAIFHNDLSIVIPAKNEYPALCALLPSLIETFEGAEIIVVDDGSSDETVNLVNRLKLKVVSHAISRGNGAAIKSGARGATRKWICFLDGDGQHAVNDVLKVVDSIRSGVDMVVGARSMSSQASLGRGVANWFYNKLATWMVDQEVKDLTSGLRVVNTDKFREFLYLLPNKFSYPTTITMAFFRAGYGVEYVPIVAEKRIGKSHVKLFQDGFRFLIIIFKIGTLYSPLKLFTPISAMFFLTGLFYYLYTFITVHRFTLMSSLFFITSVLVFLIGLVAEQITTLTYKSDK